MAGERWNVFAKRVLVVQIINYLLHRVYHLHAPYKHLLHPGGGTVPLCRRPWFWSINL